MLSVRSRRPVASADSSAPAPGWAGRWAGGGAAAPTGRAGRCRNRAPRSAAPRCRCGWRRGPRPGRPGAPCSRRIGPHAAVGRGRPDADGVGDRRQQDGGRLGVADGAGVELVDAEHARGRRRTPGRAPSPATRCGRRPRRRRSVWAAAICRLQRRANVRSGWAIGRMVPRSGQVPTTTSQPDRGQPPDGVLEVPHRHRRAWSAW